MEIYIAHPITREYLGLSSADPDPLDEGNWLIPAHAYTDAPPVVPAGHAAQRSEDGSEWLLVADHRGTVYSTGTGLAEQYSVLGDLPDGFTAEVRPSADHIWSGSGWVFDAALQLANRKELSSSLCLQVDAAADAARSAVAGDPLRAVEYDRARVEAEQFATAGYQGDAPPMVAAWAINGRTPQQAAESILAEAAQYTSALVQLRTARLSAKEQIRSAMEAGSVELAQSIANDTIANIQAAVSGIGNNT